MGLTGTLRQVARTMLFAIQDPEDETALYLGVEKSNLGPRPPASLFRKSGVRPVALSQPVARLAVEADTDRTITEWDRHFHSVASADDGRRTGSWAAVVALADKGMLTRPLVAEVYEGNTDAADKAIKRWVDAGLLIRQGQGRYEVA